MKIHFNNWIINNKNILITLTLPPKIIKIQIFLTQFPFFPSSKTWSYTLDFFFLIIQHLN